MNNQMLGIAVGEFEEGLNIVLPSEHILRYRTGKNKYNISLYEIFQEKPLISINTIKKKVTIFDRDSNSKKCNILKIQEKIPGCSSLSSDEKEEYDIETIKKVKIGDFNVSSEKHTPFSVRLLIESEDNKFYLIRRDVMYDINIDNKNTGYTTVAELDMRWGLRVKEYKHYKDINEAVEETRKTDKMEVYGNPPMHQFGKPIHHKNLQFGTLETILGLKKETIIKITRQQGISFSEQMIPSENLNYHIF